MPIVVNALNVVVWAAIAIIGMSFTKSALRRTGETRASSIVAFSAAFIISLVGQVIAYIHMIGLVQDVLVAAQRMTAAERP